MKTHRYARNVTISYLFTLIVNLDLTRGLWMIYLASKGYSLMQLGLLESIFHITSFTMEVPTGAVADLWGRKISRIAGRLSFLISLFILYTAETFGLQIIGFVVCAIGYDLESGSGEALLYDSLLLDDRKQEYMKINGRNEMAYRIAVIIAYLSGGYIASTSYPAVFRYSFLICIASLAVALFFKEPQLDGGVARSVPAPVSLVRRVFTSMSDQIRESVRVIRDRPRIAFVIIFSELIFTFLTCLFFYLQNFWKQNGHSEFYIGTVFALSAATAGITSLTAVRLEARIGERGVLLSMPVLLVLCLWGIALTPWQALFYILIGMIEGLLVVAVSLYMNAMIPSRQRATILSFQSMVFSLFMIIAFPLVGWIGDTRSLTTAFFLMACTATVVCTVYLLNSRTLLGSVSEEVPHA